MVCRRVLLRLSNWIWNLTVDIANIVIIDKKIQIISFEQNMDAVKKVLELIVGEAKKEVEILKKRTES